MNTNPMTTSRLIGTDLHKKAGSTARTYLALFVAIIMSVAFMVVPGTADAADQTNYQPPSRLRKSRYRKPEIKVEPTAAGKALADKYAAMLSGLQAEIEEQLQQIDVEKQKTLTDALAAQKLASIRYEAAHRKWRFLSLPNKTIQKGIRS